MVRWSQVQEIWEKMYIWKDLIFQGSNTKNESSGQGRKKSPWLQQSGEDKRVTWRGKWVDYAAWEARAGTMDSEYGGKSLDVFSFNLIMTYIY